MDNLSVTTCSANQAPPSDQRCVMTLISGDMTMKTFAGSCKLSLAINSVTISARAWGLFVFKEDAAYLWRTQVPTLPSWLIPEHKPVSIVIQIYFSTTNIVGMNVVSGSFSLCRYVTLSPAKPFPPCHLFGALWPVAPGGGWWQR